MTPRQYDAAEIAAIIARLTRAQRAMVAGEARSIGNPERWVLCSDAAIDRKGVPTRTVLTRLGIIEAGRFGGTLLTPLGLAVRAALQEAAVGGGIP